MWRMFVESFCIRADSLLGINYLTQTQNVDSRRLRCKYNIVFPAHSAEFAVTRCISQLLIRIPFPALCYTNGRRRMHAIGRFKHHCRFSVPLDTVSVWHTIVCVSLISIYLQPAFPTEPYLRILFKKKKKNKILLQK